MHDQVTADDDLVERLRQEFPQVPTDTIRRQVDDAAFAIELFGDHPEADELKERLVREHLKALAALRTPPESAPTA